MRVGEIQQLILILRGDIPESSALYYFPPEEALHKLRTITGVDFGYDANQWTQWAVENDHWLGYPPSPPY